MLHRYKEEQPVVMLNLKKGTSQLKKTKQQMLKFNLNSVSNFFISNKNARGTMAKKPTKNLTALKVNGPMSSMPVSCAIKVVPQINVHSNALNNETVFDIIFLDC